MKNSGSKLVLGMCCLAIIAATIGWWSRYWSTHQAAHFWGPIRAALLQGPSQVELLKSADKKPPSVGLSDVRDFLVGQRVRSRYSITDAQGLTHLRSALVEDRNYDWSSLYAQENKHSSQVIELDNSGVGFVQEKKVWAWAFRFYTSKHSMTAFLTRDFDWLGKVDEGSQKIVWISCQPLQKSLTIYFKSLEKIGTDSRSNPGLSEK